MLQLLLWSLQWRPPLHSCFHFACFISHLVTRSALCIIKETIQKPVVWPEQIAGMPYCVLLVSEMIYAVFPSRLSLAACVKRHSQSPNQLPESLCQMWISHWVYQAELHHTRCQSESKHWELSIFNQNMKVELMSEKIWRQWLKWSIKWFVYVFVSSFLSSIFRDRNTVYYIKSKIKSSGQASVLHILSQLIHYLFLSNISHFTYIFLHIFSIPFKILGLLAVCIYLWNLCVFISRWFKI